MRLQGIILAVGHIILWRETHNGMHQLILGHLAPSGILPSICTQSHALRMFFYGYGLCDALVIQSSYAYYYYTTTECVSIHVAPVALWLAAPTRHRCDMDTVGRFDLPGGTSRSFLQANVWWASILPLCGLLLFVVTRTCKLRRYGLNLFFMGLLPRSTIAEPAIC